VPSGGLVHTPAAQSLASPAGSTPHSAPAVQKYPGLPNFGVVSDQLYRGAQPDERGFAELARRGISVVVNFRNERSTIERERALVESMGMEYVSIPWRGQDDPHPDQVARFLRLLADNPQRKVFVHCRRGAERTGVMVACYRMNRERWTADRALAEMEAFGFRRRFAHLARFVREFPMLMLRDPALQSPIRR
jgi:protein tyrosine/serine phosphatase